MKRSALYLVLAVFIVGMAAAQQAASPPSLNHNFSPSTSSNGYAPTGFGPTPLSPQEIQELRAAHQAALQANPALLAANKRLMERMHDLDEKLDAAMIKADPSLAPIIAKYEAGRDDQFTAFNNKVVCRHSRDVELVDGTTHLRQKKNQS